MLLLAQGFRQPTSVIQEEETQSEFRTQLLGAALAKVGSRSGCENKGQHIPGSSADRRAKAVCQPEEGILLQINIKRTQTSSLHPEVEGKTADALCSKPAKIKSEEFSSLL